MTTEPVPQPRDHSSAISAEAARLFVRREAKRLIDEDEREAETSRVREQMRDVFTTVGAADFVAEHDAPIPYIVPRILPAGAVVAMTAASKTGKTVFALNMTAAILSGAAFLNFEAMPPYARSVLYVNGDMPAGLFRSYMRDLGLDNRLQVMNVPGGVIDISDPAHTLLLTEKCLEVGAGIVWLDVWGSVFPGDENSNWEVRRAFNLLAQVRAAAALEALIVLHHAGWGNAARARGASSFEGAVDVLWRLVGDTDTHVYFSSSGRVEPVKRIEVMYDPRTHRISAGSRDVAGSAAFTRDQARVSRESDARVKVVAAAREHPGVGKRELRAAVDLNNPAIDLAIRQLVGAGDLRTEREGSRVRHFLTEK